jgi:D-alanyl-D-alanine dipeptidase
MEYRRKQMSVPTNERDVNRLIALVKLMSVNPKSEIQLYSAKSDKENPDQQYVSIEMIGYVSKEAVQAVFNA